MLALFLVTPLLGSCAEETPTGPAPSTPHLEARGMTLGDWTRFGYASAQGRRALDDVAATGANRAVFIVTIRQATARSSSFGSLPVTPDFQAFQLATDWARERSLGVVLKLHVDIEDGTWRGFLDPADKDAWFAEYLEFVRECAEAATRAEAVTLVVGTELGRLVGHEQDWRRVIAAAREAFAGEILYAASWDEVGQVPFWDAVDAIGVDAYYPVADSNAPSRLEILAAWQPWLARLDAIRKAVGRDVVFTEIGYASFDGAGMAPMTYDTGAATDLAEQADLYWAGLAAVADVSWIRGMYWWDWPLDESGGPMDDGFSPRGKPALDELRAAWGGGS
ncbi:MAG: hypothetical protein DHS20C21_04320 [Gemmatimonadota bacterium]|nr:MAG: hypothetical protein DHS20C21_04320 [Gemmatimonadota bacterium]